MIIDRITDILNEDGDKKLGVFEGTVAKMGKYDAVRVNVDDRGNMRTTVSILCTESYEFQGKTRESKYFVTVGAFRTIAEKMAELQEGDRVAVITKPSRRKVKEKYYDNNDVIYFLKLV